MKQKLLLLFLLIGAFVNAQTAGKQSNGFNRITASNSLLLPNTPGSVNTYRPAAPVAQPMACTTAPYGQYPETTYTPLYSGSAELIASNAWAGEYSAISVVTGMQYTFSSSVSTDYITITTTGGTVLAQGTGSVAWTNTTVSGTIYYYIHSNANCGTANVSRSRYIMASASGCNAPTGIVVSNLGPHSATFTWNAVAGSQVQGYQLVYSDAQNVVPSDSYPVSITTTANSASETTYNISTTYYQYIRTICSNGTSNWVPFQFTTTANANCVTAVYGQYPQTTFVPSCTGSAEDITTNGWAGEYSVVSVSAGKRYTFTSSVSSDFISITNANGTLIASGYTPLIWNSGTTSGNIRFHTFTNNTCGTAEVSRTRSITCQTVSCGSPSGFAFSNITPTGATVTWNAASQAASYYDVNYSTQTGIPYDGNSFTQSDMISTLGVNILDLVPANTYYVYVRSVCGDILGPWVYAGTFTTNPQLVCNTAPNGMYPADTFTPSCTSSNELITANAWGGEYTNVNVTASRQYTFTSSNTTDFLTITNNAGTQVYASGTTPLVWTATISGNVRYFLHASNNCGADNVDRSRYVKCGGCSTVAPTASAQNFCGSATVANLVATGTAIKWYLASTGGTALTSTTALSTRTYYASQTLNGCEGPRVAVAVTVNVVAAPTAPDFTLCSGATVANLTATGTNIKWYLASTGGTALASTTLLTSRVYFVSQTINGCESTRNAITVNINTTAPPTANATQMFCTSGIVANLSAIGTNIKWYLASTGGTALTSSTSLSTRTYYASQTVNGCESSRVAVAVTIDYPLDVLFTIVQPTCALPTGTITITNPLGTGYTYTIAGVGVQVSQITPVFTGLPAGSYEVIATNAAGCPAYGSATINSPAAAPVAPTVTRVQPTCSVATGTITVTAPTGTGLTYSINGTNYQASTTFTGVTPGTYNVTVKNASGCISAATSAVINAAPAAPVAPTVTRVQPTCSLATGTITVTAPTGTGLTYSINGTTYQASATFTGLAAGTYSVTVKNASGCISTATSAVINAAPATPATAVFTVVQPTCALPTGTITITSPLGTGYTYSLSGNNSQSSPVFTGVQTGTYEVIATNAAGCSSYTLVTINAVPAAPAAPTVTRVQPTCSVATGTITVTAPTGTGLTYSINGTTYQSSATFTGLAAGTYSVTTKNASGCISAATSAVINAAPNAPAAPTVTRVQPTCSVATGTITLTAPTGTGLTYSINGTTYQASATFTGLAAGTYSVTVKNASGCISTATSAVINAAPATPATAVFTVVQPTCALPTGTITITSPLGTGYTYSLSGNNSQSSPVFTGVQTGTYEVIATNAAGCSSYTLVTINAVPAAPAAPTVTRVQLTCSVATGTITVTAPTGTGLTYSINGTTYQSSATFTGLAAGTYSVTAKNASGCISAATSAVINAAPNAPAAPTAAAQSLCTGATVAQLTATGTSLQWYASATATNALASTTVLSSGSYYVSQTVNGCISQRTQVDVTVNSIPVIISPADIQACSSYVLPGLQVGNYYTLGGGQGTPIASGTVITTSQRIYIYASNSCGSDEETFMVTIIPTPVIDQVSDVITCQNYILPQLAVGNYYTASGGTGTQLHAGDIITQTTVIYIYASSGTAIQCTAERNFSITIQSTVAPQADAQTFCGAPTVANLVAAGENLQWYASADADAPLAASTPLQTGVYFVSQTVNGCESSRTWVDVLVNTTSLPTGAATQVITVDIAADATIEDIVVEGSNIQWYASVEAITAGTPLAAGTQLVSGVTYYATQTVNGCESSYLAVTIEVVLKTDGKDSIKFSYYPNPVKDRLHIISGTTISLVEVYTLQGQKVINQQWNTADGELNMAQLEEATYLVRVHAENNIQTFMIAKGH